MYCKNCGNQMAQNSAFCENCGTNVETGQMNSNTNSVNQISNEPPKKKKSFGKQYLKLIGVLFLIFMATTFLRIFLLAAGILTEEISSTIGSLVTMINIFGILFGWIVILIYNEVKK